jgi:predicted secreted protein
MLREALALAALAFALPASAADRAMLNVLGYSEDSRTFAWEQYGEHDASGAPYSHVHVISLPEGEELGGGPFIVEGGEGDRLAATRAAALNQADAILRETSPSWPADPVAFVADGMPLENGDALHFGLPGTGMLGQYYGDYTIKLRRVELPSEDPFCAQVDLGQTTGYAVTVADANRSEEIHADSGPLAKDRACPVYQRLYAVYVPYGDGLLGSGVLMISEYTLGFEGQDRRFVALPIGWY